jgi:hypothetical protein
MYLPSKKREYKVKEMQAAYLLEYPASREAMPAAYTAGVGLARCFPELAPPADCKLALLVVLALPT